MKNSLLFSVKVLITSLFSAAIGSIYAQTTESFTSPGTISWTVPAGVTSIEIECWGGGGAGGGVNVTANIDQGAAGGGGKGGMYTLTTLAVTPGSTLTISVGAGGTGTTGAGNSGGASWVSTTANQPWTGNTGAWASGGNGGGGATTNIGSGATGYSSPGTGSGIIWDGGSGAPGRRLAGGNQAGGGGGGGAGTTNSGSDAIASPISGSGSPTSQSSGGTGGASFGGNGGNGAFGSSTGANSGANGNTIGGAGGGARGKNNSGAAKSASGGAGARGEVRITYTACPIPSQPVSITGLLAVCDGSTQTYSVFNDPAATSYTWTLPSGWSGTSTANSISATVGATGGTITVIANSSCGNSSQQTINVTVSSSIPNQPVTINGNLTVCANGNQTYTVANNPIATSYTWTLPSGWSGTSTTNSINTAVGTTGGTITVTANNACGSSTPQTTNVNINNIDNTVDLSGLTLTAIQTGASYQWLDCDNGNAPVAGETNQSFTPSANGNYAVEITIGGCTEVSSCTVVNSVGIKGSTADYLSIFPNPGHGVYTISGQNFQDDTSIKIYTAEGKMILQQSNFPNTDAIIIDISAHPQGIYLLEIDNQSTLVYSKIVKQ